MRLLLVALFSVLPLGNYAYAKSESSNSNLVRGYTKKDGTYVAPHQRTNPNQTQRDNWSSKPNTNPYTGKDGTKEPRK